MSSVDSTYLPKKEFLSVIRNTPLISIDLLIVNRDGKYLVGKRNNAPAHGKYFVPGGRIHKNQLHNKAFESIVKSELGLHIPFGDASFQGIYDHVYPDNFAHVDGIGTQYVVLAYHISLPFLELEKLPNAQHSDYKFLDVNDLLNSPEVHDNTKRFFVGNDNLNEAQYQILAERRSNYDNLVWSTPMLSLTALAFLMTIALGSSEVFSKTIAALLSMMTALASIQLLAKHRHMEFLDSTLLERHERSNLARGLKPIHGRGRLISSGIHWWAKLSSVKIWRNLLWAFVVASALVLVAEVLKKLNPYTPVPEKINFLGFIPKFIWRLLCG